jgi:hypothetical protein
MPRSAIESILSQVHSLSSDDRKALIAALVGDVPIPAATRRSAYGKYAGLLAVDDFLRMKHEETESEDRGTSR